MKTTFFLIPCLALSVAFAKAQTGDAILLNIPDTNRGETTMKAFAQRASSREFTGTQLNLQDLSDLLWAANGVNRPGEAKRTAPSAMNAQDIDLYVFLPAGTYLYDAAKHQLDLVAPGDNRALFSRNAADAPPALICLLVSDISRFRSGDEPLKKEWGAMDAGIVSQNISIFCASAGMATRPRAGMDKQKIAELLKLGDSQIPMLNQPVSYK